MNRLETLLLEFRTIQALYDYIQSSLNTLDKLTLPENFTKNALTQESYGQIYSVRPYINQDQTKFLEVVKNIHVALEKFSSNPNRNQWARVQGFSQSLATDLYTLTPADLIVKLRTMHRELQKLK